MANYIGNKFGKEDHDKLVLLLPSAKRDQDIGMTVDDTVGGAE